MFGALTQPATEVRFPAYRSLDVLTALGRVRRRVERLAAFHAPEGHFRRDGRAPPEQVERAQEAVLAVAHAILAVPVGAAAARAKGLLGIVLGEGDGRRK